MKKDILSYIICCVGAFAKRFHLTIYQAYSYLNRFSGIDFLISCYPAEHTMSKENAVEDLTFLCSKKGGKLL